ncbi:unnamed protein product [Cyprideis torosa]|uniref:Uncharacterized protein n=1 Tax=Cyprideis torosa TaxID=163714 RepID=A0A7R8WMS6_9CRUS|nr:unnamed protein product [Cyprideis torosa]CAG0899743.1 unnamed protein product [Cyprideis torosa]
MAETKMDIEEPSLETSRSESETTVKEKAAETADEMGTRGHQPNRRTKPKSPKFKKATLHYDGAVCGEHFKQRYNLKRHEKCIFVFIPERRRSGALLVRASRKALISKRINEFIAAKILLSAVFLTRDS